MTRSFRTCLALAIFTGFAAAADRTPSLDEILKATPPEEWRDVEPSNLMVMEMARGRVLIELAPRFAPLHVENLRVLVRERYFDGLAFLRAQDNFVVQWGDADDQRSLGNAKAELDPEFTLPLTPDTPFTALPDRDGHAPVAGFSAGFALGRDPVGARQWLLHCYGAVGVARGNEPRSGNASSLYVVIGQAPRQLDRNVSVVGRVLRGMELISTLPRGPGAMGFHERAADRVPITSVRIASELPAASQPRLQVLRSDSRSFARLLEARRNRLDDWMRTSPGHLDVCNVPVPVRDAP